VLGKDASKADFEAGRAGRQFIFSGVADRSLAGFGPFPAIWAIDWSLYFEISAKLSPQNTISEGARRVQPAYKIDSSLVNPLGFLPEFSQHAADGRGLVPDDVGNPAPQLGAIASLAHRNLLRGLRMGLPSGQDVARFMSLTPLADADIRIGKATFEDSRPGPATNKSITAYGDSFRGRAPLFTYILAEAQHDWFELAKSLPNPERDANALPVHLGAVGGRIVAEVFVGLLLGDRNSFLSQSPAWKPTLRDAKTGHFTMAELIRIATVSG